MRETSKATTSVTPDILPDDSQYKYRYKPERQNKKKKLRNRNFEHEKPATIYQIATTELSTDEKHNFRTPTSYQHESNQFDRKNQNRKSSSSSQTESFFSSDGCGNNLCFKNLCYGLIVALFLPVLTSL